MDLRYQEGDNESHLDSHVDTCAGGSNFILLDQPDQITKYVNVAPFSDEYEPMKGVPIATCATAWTSPDTGTLYLGGAYPKAFYALIRCEIMGQSSKIHRFATIRHRNTGSMTVTEDHADDHAILEIDGLEINGLESDSGDYSHANVLAKMRNLPLCSTSINAKVHQYLISDSRQLSSVHHVKPSVHWADADSLLNELPTKKVKEPALKPKRALQHEDRIPYPWILDMTMILNFYNEKRYGVHDLVFLPRRKD